MYSTAFLENNCLFLSAAVRVCLFAILYFYPAAWSP